VKASEAAGAVGLTTSLETVDELFPIGDRIFSSTLVDVYSG